MLCSTNFLTLKGIICLFDEFCHMEVIKMTVTVYVFENGEKIEERIFAGRKIEPVIEYLNENNFSYRTDKEVKEAYEITKNNNIKLICLDNMNIINVEGMANFYKEYMVEYQDEIYREILSMLNRTHP